MGGSKRFSYLFQRRITKPPGIFCLVLTVRYPSYKYVENLYPDQYVLFNS